MWGGTALPRCRLSQRIFQALKWEARSVFLHRQPCANRDGSNAGLTSDITGAFF
jgi:hypothetical protein